MLSMILVFSTVLASTVFADGHNVSVQIEDNKDYTIFFYNQTAKGVLADSVNVTLDDDSKIYIDFMSGKSGPIRNDSIMYLFTNGDLPVSKILVNGKNGPDGIMIPDKVSKLVISARGRELYQDVKTFDQVAAAGDLDDQFVKDTVELAKNDRAKFEELIDSMTDEDYAFFIKRLNALGLKIEYQAESSAPKSLDWINADFVKMMQAMSLNDKAGYESAIEAMSDEEYEAYIALAESMGFKPGIPVQEIVSGPQIDPVTGLQIQGDNSGAAQVPNAQETSELLESLKETNPDMYNQIVENSNMTPGTEIQQQEEYYDPYVEQQPIDSDYIYNKYNMLISSLGDNELFITMYVYNMYDQYSFNDIIDHMTDFEFGRFNDVNSQFMGMMDGPITSVTPYLVSTGVAKNLNQIRNSVYASASNVYLVVEYMSGAKEIVSGMDQRVSISGSKTDDISIQFTANNGQEFNVFGSAF